MNPEVTAAIIAAGVGVLTVIATVAVQISGRRATSRDTQKAFDEQRKQLDRTLAEQRTRTLNERFATAAEQLGSDKPSAVQLAGVYAMAGLADDWPENRQTCVDVLCAYLRLPYDPDPGEDADRAERAAYRANREVRHTVIRAITAHLKDDAAVSWQGLNFDFTGVVFDGGDFSGAVFSGGVVLFGGAEFFAGLTDFTHGMFTGGEVSFNEAVFSGGEVIFDGAQFSGCGVSFFRAVFSSGQVRFGGARFFCDCGGSVRFNEAVFSGGEVNFLYSGFSAGGVIFDGAVFSGGEVHFTSTGFYNYGGISLNRAKFTGGLVGFSEAKFTGGLVGFSEAEFSGGQVRFDRAKFSGSEISLDRAKFSGGEVDFSAADDWSYPPRFPQTGMPLPGVKLPKKYRSQT